MSNLHLRSPALLIPPAAGERKGAISLRARCHWLHSRCRRAARDNTPPQPLLRQCLTGCAACVIVTAALLILTLIIGVSVEGAAVAAAPSTLRYLRPNETCARNASSGAFATFPTRAALRASGNATVAHCAACGACSTDADVGVLRATAATLTATMTACALKAFSGRAAVQACVDARVGFTPPCSACWVDNVACDQQRCVFTCLYGLLRGEANNRDADAGELSPCLKCDEALCGPAFMDCAGANRRRLGITSDIGRAPAEMCNLSAA